MQKWVPYLLMALAFIAAGHCLTHLIHLDAWRALVMVIAKDLAVIVLVVISFRRRSKEAGNWPLRVVYSVLLVSLISDYAVVMLKS